MDNQLNKPARNPTKDPNKKAKARCIMMNDETVSAIVDYQTKHGIYSFSGAVVELVNKAMKEEKEK